MFGDAHGERRLRLGRADDALVGRCVEARREGQLGAVDRDLRVRHRGRDRVDDLGRVGHGPDRFSVARALEVGAAGGDARRRDVLRELQVAGAGVAQRVRLAAGGREHRPGRRGGDALVAADAVDACTGGTRSTRCRCRGSTPARCPRWRACRRRSGWRRGRAARCRRRRRRRRATLDAKTTGPLIVPDSFTASNTFTVPTTFTAAPTRRVGAAERDLEAGEVDHAGRARQRRDHRGAVGDVAVAARDAVGVELSEAVAGRAGRGRARRRPRPRPAAGG